ELGAIFLEFQPARPGDRPDYPDTAYRMQWYRFNRVQGVDIPDSPISEMLPVRSPFFVSAQGRYGAILYQPDGCQTQSNTKAVNVRPAPARAEIVQLEGPNVVVRIPDAGEELRQSYTYQWYLNNVRLPFGNDTLRTLQDDGTY